MTNQEIIMQMRRVSDAMIALGQSMRELGKMKENDAFQKHGIELEGAGNILARWQIEIERNENGK